MMTTAAIVEAHRVANARPQVHASLAIRSVDGEPVEVDRPLAPLVRALWSSDVQTIASCQNVAEYVGAMSPHHLARALEDKGPLSHARTVRDRLAYVRLINDSAPAIAFLTRAVDQLAATRHLDRVTQIEFPLEALPDLEAIAREARR